MRLSLLKCAGLVFLVVGPLTTAADSSSVAFQTPQSEKESEKARKQREKHAEKERKEKERQQKADAKEAEKERRRLAAEQPVVEYDRFADVTKVRSRPITLTNEIFGAPQKTLFGSLPATTSFQVVAVVLYKGQQTSSPNSVALVFNGQSHYHWFQNDRDLVRTEYSEGVAPTGKTNEFCAIEIPVSTFAQIVRGKSVEFRLGSQAFAMFDLTPFQSVLPKNTAQTTVPVQPEQSNEQLGVTLAGYNRLQTGMSYEEVVQILGTPGVETSRSESATLQLVMYQWTVRQPFGVLTVSFWNGKLSGKNQIGLK